MVRTFHRKVSLSLFFFLWLSHSLGCYITLTPSDYPQGFQALSILSMQPASLFSPCLLVAKASIWATSPLAVVVRCLVCVLFCFLFLPVMLPSETSKLPTDLLVRGLETSPPSLLPPQYGSPSLTLCLSFYLLYFVLSPLEENGLPFGAAWCPLPVFRSCFVEVAQHSNDLFMNLWRRKWSPCPIPLPS